MATQNLKLFFLLILINLLVAIPALARVTPNDLYQAKREAFTKNLSKISDPFKKEQVIKADQLLNQINQQVCLRFDEEINRLSAILEEEKVRQGRTDTIVAYGRGETQLDTAAYYLTYAAEAVAYQKIQDYTPQIGQGNPDTAVRLSLNNLRGNLQTVQVKILKAKQEVKKALK